MYYAVEGCCHGNLTQIYRSLAEVEHSKSIKIELLIICGDFQAVRNTDDLQCMAVPLKYRHMGDFVEYYSGRKTAPVLTLFVGGNHEASNHLWELYYGGWVAPNMYFLGYSGCVRFAGLRIAGISGIFKKDDFRLPYDHAVPYNSDTIRSIYHTRACEIEKLLLLEENEIDIVVSHDWPSGITKYGDEELLLKTKPYFRNDIENGKLGNPHFMNVLKKIKPKMWFSAHLHCKFSACVPHGSTVTKFLALDKPLEKRHYIQVLRADISPNEPRELKYDRTWLSILKQKERHLLSRIVNADHSSIDIEKTHDLVIPKNFKKDVPHGYVGSGKRSNRFLSMKTHQKVDFLSFLHTVDPRDSDKKTKSCPVESRKRLPSVDEELFSHSSEQDSFDIVSCESY